MSNLVRRNPEVDDVCPVCKIAGEDLRHNFLLCLAARQVLALSDLPWMVISDGRTDVESWLRFVTKKLDDPKGDRALTLCWQIWLNRNRWLWENDGSSPLEIVARTRRILSNFDEYNCSLIGSVVRNSPRREWQAPPEDSIKINFDGATFSDLDSTGVGVIARDSTSVCMGWRKQLVPVRASPEDIELLAAAEVVAFSKEMGWNRIIIEGDCLLAISKLRDSETDLSAFGNLVEDHMTPNVFSLACFVLSLVRPMPWLTILLAGLDMMTLEWIFRCNFL
ncbi:hypothetical protein Salat_1726100 [Sesamum alatum]|uniref:RNase H type-1 domain-containing protein n=1 Tax=Sesamum alatum TaxID=300844 RepID=A0AAE1Y7X9_9LAMI|nr:hypothetical protein Salat_1726100 [Sesamum alatum]